MPEPHVVREAKRLAEEKHRSLPEIADELQSRDHASKAATPLATRGVARVLAVTWPDVEQGICGRRGATQEGLRDGPAARTSPRARKRLAV